MDISKILIDKWNMLPHPEGGYYVRVATCTQGSWSSSYYLLPVGERSCWHRPGGEEIIFFHGGDPLLVHQIDRQGNMQTEILGNLRQGAFQIIIPEGNVLAMECADNQAGYSLISCLVRPAFDFARFSLCSADELSVKFPRLNRGLLEEFTKAKDRS